MGFGTPIRARPALLGRDTSRGGRGEGRETALTECRLAVGSDLAQHALNASLAKHKKFRKCGDVFRRSLRERK